MTATGDHDTRHSMSPNSWDTNGNMELKELTIPVCSVNIDLNINSSQEPDEMSPILTKHWCNLFIVCAIFYVCVVDAWYCDMILEFVFIAMILLEAMCDSMQYILHTDAKHEIAHFISFVKEPVPLMLNMTLFVSIYI